MIELDDSRPPANWDKLNNTHFVFDGEQIVIDRRQFRATRSPESTEDVEVIDIQVLPLEKRLANETKRLAKESVC